MYRPHAGPWPNESKTSNAHKASAQQLKASIPFSIFDKETVPRTRSWGMGFGWSVPYLRALLSHSILERLHTTYIDPHWKPEDTEGLGVGSVRVFNGQTGQPYHTFGDRNTRKVARDRFRALLAEDINISVGLRDCEAVTEEDSMAKN